MFDFKKILSAVVSMALCCSVVTAIPAAAANGYYNTYDTIKSVPDDKSSGKNICSMQGMAVGSSFIYTAKTDESYSRAVIYKCNSKTGNNIALKYVDGGKTMNYIPDLLGHANDMCVNTENGKSCLYVATATNDSGKSQLVRMRVDGSNIYKAGTFKVVNTQNNKLLSVTSVTILNKSGEKLNFLLKNGETVYHASVSTNSTSGTIYATPVFKINKSNAVINGSVTDLSGYTNQGMSYFSKNDKLYVPLSSNTKPNVSVVVVYDNISSITETALTSPKASIQTLPTSKGLSFRITSSTYSNLFEIESCGVCSTDGRLYFNTNRRKTKTDSNHDAILRFKDYSAF